MHAATTIRHRELLGRFGVSRTPSARRDDRERQPATGFDLDHRCGFGSPAFTRIAS